MKKIDQTCCRQFLEPARACIANRVYPMSIAEGMQSGDIYIDGNGAVLFWHRCGFGYISGNAEPGFLQEVYEDFLLAERDHRFLLITCEEAVTGFFGKQEGLSFEKRIEYAYSGSLRPLMKPDERFVLERLTGEHWDALCGRIVPAFSWESKEQFLRYGFGFAFRDGDRIAASAFTGAVSTEEVDIGIETCEEYRRQGLAVCLARIMCEEIRRQGKKPVWAHAGTNAGSGRTAAGAGFLPVKVNTVIRKRPGAGSGCASGKK